jgi:3-dehydroquinate dehydratase / shikimate dehydrogenase
MSFAPDRVCVVVGRTRHKMMQAELQEAVKRGAKFLEVRLDFLAKAVDFKRLAPFKSCPWVATIRRPQDGGRWSGTEDERQMLMRQAIVSGLFDWIDVEMDIAPIMRRFGTVKRIISYHHMTETPVKLDELYEQMAQLDGDVYKIAVMAQNATDNAKVLEIQKRATKPTIAFCMGELGFPTRFMSLKYGAPWIYAAFNKERGVAPGLPSTDDFRTTFPVRSINAETKFYGLLGDPVGHSYSPVLHNHTFGRMKINAIYLPFRVPKGQLQDAVSAFDSVPVSGYSVTIPHKEDAVQLASHSEPNVQRAGAANTLSRQEDGSFLATNFDYTAAVDSLKAHLAERNKIEPTPQLNQMFVLILGAGGAARAIAHGLHKEGAAITICARTFDRAAKLAAEVGCKVIDWQGRHNVLPCDIAINCTPVGMHPNMDETPLHPSFLKPGLTVFDTVYTPENTMLIREARIRGCHLVTGVDMFVRQAARQFELFTGVQPDVDKMREVLRKAMSPLTRALDDEAEEPEAE